MKNSNSNSNTVSKVKVEVIDFSGMSESEILTWCKEKNLNCDFIPICRKRICVRIEKVLSYDI